MQTCNMQLGWAVRWPLAVGRWLGWEAVGSLVLSTFSTPLGPGPHPAAGRCGRVVPVPVPPLLLFSRSALAPVKPPPPLP
jgi:hypothetical protein